MKKKRSRKRFMGVCRCCQKTKNMYARGLCLWCHRRRKDEFPILPQPALRISRRLLVLLPVFRARISQRETVARAEDNLMLSRLWQKSLEQKGV